MIRTITKWVVGPAFLVAMLMFSSPQQAQAQAFGFSIGGPRGGGFGFYSAPGFYRGVPIYSPRYRVPSYRYYQPRYYAPRYVPRYVPRVYAPRAIPRYYRYR